MFIIILSRKNLYGLSEFDIFHYTGAAPAVLPFQISRLFLVCGSAKMCRRYSLVDRVPIVAMIGRLMGNTPAPNTPSASDSADVVAEIKNRANFHFDE